jgi:hypothetical protein
MGFLKSNPSIETLILEKVSVRSNFSDLLEVTSFENIKCLELLCDFKPPGLTDLIDLLKKERKNLHKIIIVIYENKTREIINMKK